MGANIFSPINIFKTKSIFPLGITVVDPNGLGFTSSPTIAADLFLRRDSANTLGLRNGVNAQAFNIYNTFTSLANNELLSISYIANVAQIQSGKNGAGTIRDLSIGTANGAFFFDSGGLIFRPQVDNTQQLGDATHRFSSVDFVSWKAGGGIIASSFAGGNVAIASKIANYSGINTAGLGLAVVYAGGRSTAQIAAVASVVTYTNNLGGDGTFEISANVLVTTSTTHNFTVTVAYTDENNVARTLTLPFIQLAGTILTAITNVTGAGPYEGIVTTIRSKAATAITVATAGTFTTVTYNVEGYIKQLST